MRSSTVNLFGLLIVSCLAACGPGSDYPPQRSAVIPLDGQVLFPVALDSENRPFHMVVDTGAVRSVAEEALLREVVNGVGKVTIDFGHGLVLQDYEVIAADLSEAVNHIGTPLHGLIGQDLFFDYFFGLDYRNSKVYMDELVPESPPPGFSTNDGVNLTYELVQNMPVMNVDIGGRTAKLIADTGSGVTILTRSFVEQQLLESGLEGYIWYTSYGSDPSTIVRLPSIKLGGIEVADSWAVVVPDDFHLKQVFEMLGIYVDGFIGYPVYRRFFIEIFGAENRYVFYPYPNNSHVDANEWDRVGCEIMRADGQVTVDMIFAGSDAAAQGLAAGDILVAVDGTQVSTLELDQIRLMLRGSPDDSRNLSIVRQSNNLELYLAVDRLLPPLQE
ncbi:MAG: aspartyl protease family protein [Deltaproteobacteria bacterium]|nr:aspartyl protease family protein [Deltaproteobacteria bacterium]